MHHGEACVEPDRVEPRPELAHARARAFAEDAVHVPVATPAPHHAVEGTHCVVGELHGSVARRVAEIAVADLRLVGCNHACGQAQPLVLAGAMGEEARRAEPHQRAVGHHRTIPELRADDRRFGTVALPIVGRDLGTEQEQGDELAAQHAVVWSYRAASRDFEQVCADTPALDGAHSGVHGGAHLLDLKRREDGLGIGQSVASRRQNSLGVKQARKVEGAFLAHQHPPRLVDPAHWMHAWPRDREPRRQPALRPGPTQSRRRPPHFPARASWRCTANSLLSRRSWSMTLCVGVARSSVVTSPWCSMSPIASMTPASSQVRARSRAVRRASGEGSSLGDNCGSSHW